MFRRRLLGARPGTMFILQELYFRKRLPSRLHRARVRIKIHSRNSYQLCRNVNNTGYFSMLNLPTSDCGSKVKYLRRLSFLSLHAFCSLFKHYPVLLSKRKKQSFLYRFPESTRRTRRLAKCATRSAMVLA